jgi:competence protein ComEA
MSNYFNKYWIIIMAILLLSLISGGVLMAIELSSHQAVEIVLEENKTPEYKLEVFIGGAVANPGYYPVKEEDTLTGIVQSAGLTSNAIPGQIKIYVPAINEITSQQKPQKINLNRAETWLFEALPGIGQSKAQAIVDYRNKYGYFHRIEDLLKINGISKSILDNIRNLIVVEE